MEYTVLFKNDEHSYDRGLYMGQFTILLLSITEIDEFTGEPRQIYRPYNEDLEKDVYLYNNPETRELSLRNKNDDDNIFKASTISEFRDTAVYYNTNNEKYILYNSRFSEKYKVTRKYILYNTMDINRPYTNPLSYRVITITIDEINSYALSEYIYKDLARRLSEDVSLTQYKPNYIKYSNKILAHNLKISYEVNEFNQCRYRLAANVSKSIIDFATFAISLPRLPIDTETFTVFRSINISPCFDIREYVIGGKDIIENYSVISTSYNTILQLTDWFTANSCILIITVNKNHPYMVLESILSPATQYEVTLAPGNLRITSIKKLYIRNEWIWVLEVNYEPYTIQQIQHYHSVNTHNKYMINPKDEKKYIKYKQKYISLKNSIKTSD